MVFLLLQHDTAETKGYVQGAVDTVVGGVQLDLAALAASRELQYSLRHYIRPESMSSSQLTGLVSLLQAPRTSSAR
jgi:hypothetical protein